MMTIKHIEDDGRERVVSAVSVSFDPERNELIGYGAPPTTSGAMASVRFVTGHAFVMNEQGKTVAAYNLRTKK